MIKIYIPNNNIKEREYIIDIILGEFLGVSYQLIIDNGELRINDWILELENGNRLIIEDCFFNNFPKDLEYLKEKNIPKEVKFIKNRFAPEDDIVVIYGNTNAQKPETNNQKLKTNIDLFASAFFMLTRWEEYVNKTRDNHNRFSAKDSLAYKCNFLHRPIVNEYVEMLWNMLTESGMRQQRREREFKFVMTHDVDMPFRYFSTKGVLKEVARDFVKNKKYIEPLKKLYEYSQIKIGLKQDPFDTFDYMIDREKSSKLESYYFFMGRGTDLFYDDNYPMNDNKIKELTKKILNNGHQIGIHPSYNTYDNSENLRIEKNIIEKNIGQPIKFGRQHYLRFEVPTTWQIWEENGMEWDSTLSYADKEGFRCGVCYEYSVFNILTRQKLRLKEKPLIVMEGSFTTYQPDIKSHEMLDKIETLLDSVKRYDGEFVFLWHNSSFSTDEMKGVYDKVLEMVKV